MCNPMLAVMAVATAASAAMQGVQASQQADAQKTAANYNAQVQANNAMVASQQRSVTIQNGQAQAANSEMQQAQLLGKQRAAFAANGMDLHSGSAVDVLTSTKVLGNQDVATIQTNAARQAWGYAVEGNNYTAQSNLDKWQADSTNPAAIGAMTGSQSLLTSASSYAMTKFGG